MGLALALGISVLIYLLGSGKKRVNGPFACGERIYAERVTYISTLFPYIAMLLAIESSILLLLAAVPVKEAVLAVMLLAVPVIVND